MEKQALLSRPQPGPPSAPFQPSQRPRHRLILPTVLALCILASISRHSFIPSNPPPEPNPPSSEFTWISATASPHLNWEQCYDWIGSFQCAKLEVPMDYFNGTTDARVQLALVKRPAQVNVLHPQYGGAVLLNPGGPGGSGVAFAIGGGDGISSVIDTNQTSATQPEGGLGEGKFFDLIGWDPRGVGETTPGISCIQDEGLAWAWQMRIQEEGILGSSDANLGRLWSMAQARGGSCALPREDGEADLKRYASTASTARDMVSIVEAHGEWREMEARRLLGMPEPGEKGPKKRIQVPQKLMWNRGEEKLQYWGFSYGSYLGLTFAAMFPDKIGRLIVDGVVDTYDYRKSLWYDNLLDTEKGVDHFYEDCARAGYPKCALANKTSVGETTPEGVKARADTIIKHLYHNPLPVVGPNPEVITYSDVRGFVLGALYAPVFGFPILASILATIEAGNGTEIAWGLRRAHEPYCPSETPPKTRDWSRYTKTRQDISMLGEIGLGAPGDALNIIACTDGDSQAGLSKAEFEKHLQREIKLSPSAGAIWSAIRLQCIHFPLRAHHRFTAPFSTSPNKPSHPLLLIGNTADPVTPGRNAINLAKAYEGSVALIQDSPGHCSLAAASRCTMGWVRRYFQSGELPPEGTVCEVEQRPFEVEFEMEGEADNDDGREIREVREAVRKVREGMYAAGGGSGGVGVGGMFAGST